MGALRTGERSRTNVTAGRIEQLGRRMRRRNMTTEYTLKEGDCGGNDETTFDSPSNFNFAELYNAAFLVAAFAKDKHNDEFVPNDKMIKALARLEYAVQRMLKDYEPYDAAKYTHFEEFPVHIEHDPSLKVIDPDEKPKH